MTREPAQPWVSPRRVWSVWGLRAPAALALALLAVTCRDATGPHGTGAGRGQVVFAPTLPSEAALASFGLAVDQVRIILVGPQTPPDTLVDTTVVLPPDSANVTVASGFVNNGAIVLTDTTSSYGAALNVTSGTLTNAAGATITAAGRTGGTRSLNARRIRTAV